LINSKWVKLRVDRLNNYGGARYVRNLKIEIEKEGRKREEKVRKRERERKGKEKRKKVELIATVQFHRQPPLLRTGLESQVEGKHVAS
jgi:hypothetical protein